MIVRNTLQKTRAGAIRDGRSSGRSSTNQLVYSVVIAAALCVGMAATGSATPLSVSIVVQGFAPAAITDGGQNDIDGVVNNSVTFNNQDPNGHGFAIPGGGFDTSGTVSNNAPGTADQASITFSSISIVASTDFAQGRIAFSDTFSLSVSPLFGTKAINGSFIDRARDDADALLFRARLDAAPIGDIQEFDDHLGLVSIMGQDGGGPFFLASSMFTLNVSLDFLLSKTGDQIDPSGSATVAVPEPPAFGLAVMGLIGLLVYHWCSRGSSRGRK